MVDEVKKDKSQTIRLLYKWLYKRVLYRPEYVDLYILESIDKYKHVGLTEQEAIGELLKKHRQILLNSELSDIVDTMLKHKDIYGKFGLYDTSNERKYYQAFRYDVAVAISRYGFEVVNGKLKDENKIIGRIKEVLLSYYIVEKLNSEKLFLDEKHKEATKPANINGKEVKVSIKEIALRCVYENRSITRKNADEIVEQYGHKSGEKLFQEYTKFKSQTNRRGQPLPWSEKALKNKITLFKKVAGALSGNPKEKVLEDIKILETMYYDEYK